MNNLFYIYLSLYPSKADIILDAIRRGIEEADSLHMTGKKKECCDQQLHLRILRLISIPRKVYFDVIHNCRVDKPLTGLIYSTVLDKSSRLQYNMDERIIRLDGKMIRVDPVWV